MTKFDPSCYSNNYAGRSTYNYSERSIRRSTSNPLPVSFTDQAFLDQVAETTKIFDVKKRVLPGPVMKTEEDWKWKGKKCSTELNTIIRERKKEMKEKELKEKSVLLRGGESQLWGSADRREREKVFPNCLQSLIFLCDLTGLYFQY